MSDQSAITRAHLLRIMMYAVIAVVALLLAVGGMVAYSSHVVDQQAAATERKLVSRRVERRLEGLREDLLSATVWNEAFTETVARNADWMQVNYGDYYADYMHHQVTAAFDGDGRPIYASRDSEPTRLSAEAALIAAVQPLVVQVRNDAARPSGKVRTRFGLDAVRTRQATVMVGGEPYFVVVSSVVPEDAEHDQLEAKDPVVASGVALRTFVASLGPDLMLADPEMVSASEAVGDPTVVPIKSQSGEILAGIRWKPARTGAALLAGSVPALGVLLLLLIGALTLGGVRIHRLLTDLAYNEDALDRSLAEAEAANAAKSQFLANMSHELRTPLNGIIAMTELLRDHQIDERGREMARTIVSSGHTLEHVVNDILDVAKVEAGVLQFETAPFDLSEVLEAAAALHGASAAAKNVALNLSIHASAAGVYSGDRTRVSQVVSNLVGNAVKFTEIGCVQIVARRRRGGDLCISVSDTGPGFDRATASRLFQRFEQADASVSRRYGGTGLGLAICASLTQIMGGRVSVRSVPGRGSTFFAHMPLPRTGDACEKGRDHKLVPEAQERQIRVLYADDHAVNRQVVSMILEPLGVSMMLAEDGAQAVQAAQAAAFDVILMDVQMPGMDGLTATRAIRSHEAAHGLARTPIISLTANAMADDVRRSLEAGSDRHLPKPIRPAALLEAIDALLAEQPAAPNTMAA